MNKIDDVQVWAAMDARHAEVVRWRVIDFYKGRIALAVRDLEPLPRDAASINIDPTEYTAERHEFQDAFTARRYIEWRAMKAALEEYEGSGQ